MVVGTYLALVSVLPVALIVLQLIVLPMWGVLVVNVRGPAVMVVVVMVVVVVLVVEISVGCSPVVIHVDLVQFVLIHQHASAPRLGVHGVLGYQLDVPGLGVHRVVVVVLVSPINARPVVVVVMMVTMLGSLWLTSK